MGTLIDISGQRFGRFIVLCRAPNQKEKTRWLCRCDCGTVKSVDGNHLRCGRIKSCGCFLSEVLHSEKHRQHCIKIARRPKSHGLSKTPVYSVWKTMRQRCKNPNCFDYRWYGALGVKVCERWESFENFYEDMGEPNGLTLDRIDPTGDYTPENCQWVAWDVQRQNKRRKNAVIVKRRVRQSNATPKWVNLKDIEKIYNQADWLRKFSGEKYHVDHIVPLRGQGVCGLHVPWNLQILTEKENKKKGYYYETG